MVNFNNPHGSEFLNMSLTDSLGLESGLLKVSEVNFFEKFYLVNRKAYRTFNNRESNLGVNRPDVGA